MQNFSLLKRAGAPETGAAQARHVGNAGRISDGAEYVMSEETTRSSCVSAECGLSPIIPAIPSTSASCRSTALSHLPIVVTPATARKAQQVTPLSRAAIAVARMD